MDGALAQSERLAQLGDTELGPLDAEGLEDREGVVDRSQNARHSPTLSCSPQKNDIPRSACFIAATLLACQTEMQGRISMLTKALDLSARRKRPVALPITHEDERA